MAKSILKKIGIINLNLLLTACSTSSIHKNQNMPLLSINDIKYENVIQQGFDWSCGVSSLANLLTEGLGDNVSEKQLIQAISKSLPALKFQDAKEHGLTMKQLADLAKILGYEVNSPKLNAEQIEKIGIPIIVRINNFDGPHFVILSGVYNNGRMKYAAIVDPASGNIKMPFYQFIDKWLEEKTMMPVLLVQRKDHLWKENSALFI